MKICLKLGMVEDGRVGVAVEVSPVGLSVACWAEVGDDVCPTGGVDDEQHVRSKSNATQATMPLHLFIKTSLPRLGGF